MARWYSVSGDEGGSGCGDGDVGGNCGFGCDGGGDGSEGRVGSGVGARVCYVDGGGSSGFRDGRDGGSDGLVIEAVVGRGSDTVVASWRVVAHGTIA